MPSSTPLPSEEASTEYTIHDLGQMLLDVQFRLANTEKEMLTHCFDQEAFIRQQTQVNKNLDDHMTQILAAVDRLSRPNLDAAPPPTTTRGWHVPPSTVTKPASFDPDSWPKLRLDPPRFDGANVTRWITRIQKYYNQSSTPLANRLYLTEFLLDDAAAEWFTYWESNNVGRSWDEFLTDIKLRFDPDLYEDYAGRLATLRQTGSLDDYLADFEPLLSKISNVGDSTLTSLFIAGLRSSLKAELLTRRPASLCEAMALARQLATAQPSAVVPHHQHTRTTAPRDNQPTLKYTPPHARPTEGPRPSQHLSRPSRDGPPKDYPIVQLSAAEQKANKEQKSSRTSKVALAPDPDDSNAANPVKVKTETKRKAFEIDSGDNDEAKSDNSSAIGEPMNNTTKETKKMTIVAEIVEEERVSDPNVVSNCRIAMPLRETLKARGLVALFLVQAQQNQWERGVDIVTGIHGRIKDAREVFKLIPEKKVYSSSSLLNGFAMHGSAHSANEFLEKMVTANVKPNPVTFIGVLTACSHDSLLDEGSIGDLQDALHLVKTMPMEPNEGVWGALLGACRLPANPNVSEFAVQRFFKLEPSHADDSNFHALCTGETAGSIEKGNPLQGPFSHRIKEGYVAQGGEVRDDKRKGNESKMEKDAMEEHNHKVRLKGKHTMSSKKRRKRSYSSSASDSSTYSDMDSSESNTHSDSDAYSFSATIAEVELLPPTWNQFYSKKRVAQANEKKRKIDDSRMGIDGQSDEQKIRKELEEHDVFKQKREAQMRKQMSKFVHDVFHVSLLRSFVRSTHAAVAHFLHLHLEDKVIPMGWGVDTGLITTGLQLAADPRPSRTRSSLQDMEISFQFRYIF